VPAIGCDCAVCHSADPRDRRTRPSILIELPDPREAYTGAQASSPFAHAVRYVLVDTSTDLRAQALAYDVRRVDAILYTHSHADHVLGLDEVRRYNAMQRSPMAAYGDRETLSQLRRIFSYIFEPQPQAGGGLPQITLFNIGGPFMLGAAEIVPVPLFHGMMPVLGFRIGSFAYLTDCNRIPDGSWPLLVGVRVLVLDALRDRKHSTHFSVSEALEVVARLRPDRAYFTHICHDLPHAATCARLPPGVELAYDGQILEIA
jgi:phosphoribosyl 1,2-cyclic phosphate phosphodiesterase